MPSKRKKRVYWTKKNIKHLLTEWDNVESTRVLASDFGCDITTVSNMARRLRKEGFDLPIKNRSGYLRSLIAEMYDKD